MKNKLFWGLTILFLMSCSLGGDLDEWREAAVEANDTGLLTVTFNAKGGSPAPGSIKTEYGAIIDEPGEMTKEFNEFEGWYKDQACTKKWDFGTDTVIANTTLYANWIFNEIEFQIWLSGQESGTLNVPVDVKLDINLGDMQVGSGWRQLLSRISLTGKYVALDLSVCKMAGDTFNTTSALSTGKDKIVSIILPDAAKIIGDDNDGVFSREFSNLKSVSSKYASVIGVCAFMECRSLTSVDFPAVTSIGAQAFSSCRGLTSVDFPSVTSIGDAAFGVCTGLISVSFPAVTSIGDGAFNRCDSLTSMDFPALTNIGDHAFLGCASLIRVTSVDFPAVTSIGEQAFFDCSNMTSVSLPIVTSIGDSAFSRCNSLTSVDFPSATSIGKSAFGDPDAGCPLVSVNIPAVTSIGDGAFSYNGFAGMTVFLGNSAPTLGINIFIYATGTVRVTVPAGANGYGNSPTDTTVDNWGNAFRGKGWDGTSYLDGTANGSINLTIQYGP